MYEKIKLLCDQKEISISSLEKTLGFSTGSMCKWKKSIPSADKLQMVAVYFDVPITYFLENTIK